MRNITIISNVAVTMPGTASKAADDVSSWAPELTFCPGSMNVNSGTLCVYFLAPRLSSCFYGSLTINSGTLYIYREVALEI